MEVFPDVFSKMREGLRMGKVGKVRNVRMSMGEKRYFLSQDDENETRKEKKEGGS